MVDLIFFSDILIGIGVTSFLYFGWISASKDYLRTIIYLTFINIGYSILKFLMFGKVFVQLAEASFNQFSEYLNTGLQNNPEQLSIGLDVLRQLKEIVMNYYPGIWVFSVVIGIYLGSLLFSKKVTEKWEHKKLQLPFYLIYILILLLIALISEQTRIIGINGLLMIIPFFLFQGISILHFFWGDFFVRSRFLLYLMIISMILNPYLLLLVVLVGMLDIWFNFRKIGNTLEEVEK